MSLKHFKQDPKGINFDMKRASQYRSPESSSLTSARLSFINAKKSLQLEYIYLKKHDLVKRA